MNNVKITFETNNSFIGRAIRWFTRGRVDHVAIEYGSSDWESKWATEAALKGVVARPARNRKWSYVASTKYDATRDLRVIQEFIGQKYDFVSFFLWAFFILAWRWLRVKIRKPFMKSKSQYCSEYAAHLLVARKGPVVDPQWVTPEQLLTELEKYPDDYKVDKIESA
jgi:hypothetical protein